VNPLPFRRTGECRNNSAGDHPGAFMRKFRVIHLLLFVPYPALAWVPYYNRALPDLFGIPFFYWYQLLWIPLGAVLLLPIYRAEKKK
jgi:hypothetical protein